MQLLLLKEKTIKIWENESSAFFYFSAVLIVTMDIISFLIILCLKYTIASNNLTKE